MLKRSLTEDAQEVFRAIALIELGARMQVLESELTLSRDRMIRLYREVKGVSPPKGMLPFSADWYMTWLANIHASLFYNTYLFLKNEARCSHLDALTKGYRLYLEHCQHSETEPVLDLTRAWTLVRFLRRRHPAVDQMLPLYRQVRRAQARPAAQRRVRRLPAAVACRQNEEGSSRAPGSARCGAGCAGRLTDRFAVARRARPDSNRSSHDSAQ
ncbi:hypothetical protein OKW38_005707 [Paraburkholderia sp. MM5496-R1]